MLHHFCSLILIFVQRDTVNTGCLGSFHALHWANLCLFLPNSWQVIHLSDSVMVALQGWGTTAVRILIVIIREGKGALHLVELVTGRCYDCIGFICLLEWAVAILKMCWCFQIDHIVTRACLSTWLALWLRQILFIYAADIDLHEGAMHTVISTSKVITKTCNIVLIFICWAR